MPVDHLITTCQHLVRFLRQSANYARANELTSLAASLERAAHALEAAIANFLAAPAYVSMPSEASWIDEIIESLRDPRSMPTRLQVLWALAMLRRARRLLRIYLAAAEITEPAERVVEGQLWLDELEKGPPTA